MGDVAFLLDTTGSMSGTANAMASEFSAIVTALNALIPDAEYGFATYDDYAYAGYGYSSSGDKPFILRQQITDNTAAVQAELSGVPIHFGGDGPESGMEALYQGASGGGYDQNCNGIYDSATDVKPFLSSADDAFVGAGGQSYNSTDSGGGFIGGFGFRDYEIEELRCQGIKPWDPEARAAVEMLFPGRRPYDPKKPDPIDDSDDDYDDDYEPGLFDKLVSCHPDRRCRALLASVAHDSQVDDLNREVLANMSKMNDPALLAHMIQTFKQGLPD